MTVKELREGNQMTGKGGERKMKTGDYVRTPRFLNVKISEMFQTEKEAREKGFVEMTHYWDDPEYGVLGKSNGWNQMIFAGYKR